jgi:hypothetical protein
MAPAAIAAECDAIDVPRVIGMTNASMQTNPELRRKRASEKRVP